MPKLSGAGAAAFPDLTALTRTTLLSALDAAGVGVIIAHLDPRSFGPVVRYLNSAAERITGHVAEDVLGRSPRVLQAPLTDRETLSRFKQAMRDGDDLKIQTVNRRKDGEEYQVEWTIAPVRNDKGASDHWIALLRDLSEERRLRRYFATELQHRTKNLLATIRSIAARTLAQTREASLFAGRIAALARIQGLLGRAEKDEVGVDLGELISTELASHNIPQDRLTIAGDAISLPLGHVETLALAVHELAINARQHGALASPDGALSVGWSAGDCMVTLHWMESNVERLDAGEPGRGYGLELIENALPFSLGARTRLEFQPNGFWCQIDVPLPARDAAYIQQRINAAN